MSRTQDLGWAWKGPNKPTWKAQRKQSRKGKRKARKAKKLDRYAWLCFHAKGDEFYLSPEWLKLRREVLTEYGYQCMKCEAVDAVMQVDHIKPRSKFPRLSLKFRNLQVLCLSCNKEKSNLHDMDYREEAATRALDLEAISGYRKWG